MKIIITDAKKASDITGSSTPIREADLIIGKNWKILKDRYGVDIQFINTRVGA